MCGERLPKRLVKSLPKVSFVFLLKPLTTRERRSASGDAELDFGKREGRSAGAARPSTRARRIAPG